MLTKQDLSVLATVFGKSADDISSAITSEEEKPLDLRLNGKVYTQQEIDGFKTAHTNAGIEIASKNFAKALNITLEPGEKEPDKVAAKVKDSLTIELEKKFKSQTPTDELKSVQKKAQEMEDKYKQLFKTHEADKKALGEWESKYSKLENDNRRKQLNTRITNAFPEKMKMDRNDALLIFNNTFSFEKTEDGKEVVKRGDSIVQDPVGEPETLDNIVKSFTEEKKWVKGAGTGTGDDDKTGGKALPKGLTEEQAYKYLEEKGMEPMSPEGGKLFRKLVQPAGK